MSVLDHAKELAALIKKYNDQDLYARIIDLRDEIFELREENLELKEKLKPMEDAQDVSKELKRESNAYFRHHPDGTKTGPYCFACWDTRKKLVNMMAFAYGILRCAGCDPEYHKHG
jgi:hypothetical protein